NELLVVHRVPPIRGSLFHLLQSFTARGLGRDDLEMHLVFTANVVTAPTDTPLSFLQDPVNLTHLGRRERARDAQRVLRGIQVNSRTRGMVREDLRASYGAFCVAPVVELPAINLLNPLMKLGGNPDQKIPGRTLTNPKLASSTGDLLHMGQRDIVGRVAVLANRHT